MYIIDALDDFSEDMKASEYNPISARFGVTSDKLPQDISDEVAGTLHLSINAVLRAFELLQTDENTALIRNIIELGMKNSVARILQKEK